MSQHTPGPWMAHVEQGFPLTITGNSGLTIARLGAHHSAPLDPEENEANARLIAAVPELLAVVKDIEALGECYCGTAHDEGRCLTCRARDAIRKAQEG